MSNLVIDQELTDMSTVTREDTVALYVRGELNLIHLYSRFIASALQMAKEPEISEAAKRALLSTAESLAISASSAYCALVDAYRLPEEK